VQRRIGAIEQLESRHLLAGEPTILEVAPRMGATGIDLDENFTLVFSEPMDPTTIHAGTIELRDQFGRNIAATVSYDPATMTATLDPSADLPPIDNYFTATVKGGEAGVKDESGNALVADFRWSASTGQPEFLETTVFSQVINPTVIKFAADGRAFVAEKSGRIWVFDSIADTEPDLFANLHVNVHNFWDRGLLGMALAPNFPADPHVYVLYTYDGDIPGTSPGGNPAVAAPKFGDGVDLFDPGPGDVEQGAWVSGRLSRLTADGNFMIGEEEVLIHDWPQQFPSHSLGALAFAPDGTLYASAGDGASFLYADYGQPVGPNPGNPFGDPAGEGGALRSQDLLSPADATTLDGTIIRVDPATGAALPTNPLFATGNDENARRVIAHGLRNPYRFAFRPGTDEIWIGDVGWLDWEEIDRIESPLDGVVENFGWPAYEGPERQDQYDPLDLPLLEELYAAGPEAHSEPYFAYHHSQKVDPAADEPISIFASITGVAFGQGGNLPSAFDGALFFCDWVRQYIWVMYRGVDGLPDPTNVRAFTPAALSVVNLETGPDGSLYYVNFDGHTIQRLRFVDGGSAFEGTEGHDALTLRSSTDGALLEIHSGNPPEPGSVPIFTWPMDATVPLSINTMAGDDTIVVDLPVGAVGPAGGIRLEAAAGANHLLVENGNARIDSTATGGSLDTNVVSGAQLSTSRLNQNGLTIGGGGRVTILPGGTQASVITSLEFVAMFGGAPDEPEAAAKEDQRTAVVSRFPDRDTSPSEGLQTSDPHETFGRINVRGQETRAQHGTRAQHSNERGRETRAQQAKHWQSQRHTRVTTAGSFAGDDRLVDLLADAIAAEGADQRTRRLSLRFARNAAALFAEPDA
jgi:glucose/arabinose dehydrogenase